MKIELVALKEMIYQQKQMIGSLARDSGSKPRDWKPRGARGPSENPMRAAKPNGSGEAGNGNVKVGASDCAIAEQHRKTFATYCGI